MKSGHFNIGRLTQFYGDNAMRWATNIRTKRGYLCFRPTTRMRGVRFRWKCYWSPNATPWARKWGFGPGCHQLTEQDRECARNAGYDWEATP